MRIVQADSDYSTDSQITLAVNRGSFNSILKSQADSAVSGFSNDFKNEHQSIFIHYGLKIDCLVNQLQCIATVSTSLCQSRKTEVGSKTLIQISRYEQMLEHSYFDFSNSHNLFKSSLSEVKQRSFLI